jgi:presenilin-like A22 family membrane protease
MKISTIFRLKPVYWSIVIFILSQGFTFLVIAREDVFLNKKNISVPIQPPQAITLWPGQVTSPSGEVTQVPAVSSLGPILIYFFAVVVLLGIVLFSIPISALRTVFKVIFAFLYCWSIFIISIFWLPLIASIAIAVIISALWFFTPRVWLHSLVMAAAMVALGAVFGRFLSPWTVMILLLVLALYDFLAVRFGYMLWMAKKLSQSSTLPAFIIPYRLSEWTSSLKESDIAGITEEKSVERKYSILGGGDIGFPILLVSSVYFAHGFNSAILVAIFSLVGLVGAYWIQTKFLKGKAMPALPPIAILSLIGLVLISIMP